MSLFRGSGGAFTTSRIKASIDIGSNSCLFLAGEYERNKFTVHSSLNKITGLAKKLDKTGKFAPEAMGNTLEALKKFREECDSLNIHPSEVLITATEASRVAQNAKDFFHQVKKQLGFTVTIINAQGEAHYAALGVSLGGNQWDETKSVLVDIGGASTELIRISTCPFRILSSLSLPVGSVRLSEWRQEKSSHEKWDDLLGKFTSISQYKTPYLIGVSGSVCSQAAIYKKLKSYCDTVIHGLEIPISEYQTFYQELQKRSLQNLRKEFPYLDKRIPYIHSGAYILKSLSDLLNIEKIYVSTYGLRHGVLFSQGIEEQFVFEGGVVTESINGNRHDIKNQIKSIN